jgi:hypothetical protein
LDAFAIVPGAQVGPYEVLDTLGRGGMGVVFRARHIQNGKLYALKTVKAQSPHLLSSIRREIQRLRRLSHPGVVQLRDDGVFRNLPWYTMELFDCGTWEQFNEHHHQASAGKRKPLPQTALQELLIRALSLCDALAYIHGEGVVHRELCPSTFPSVIHQIMQRGGSASEPQKGVRNVSAQRLQDRRLAVPFTRCGIAERICLATLPVASCFQPVTRMSSSQHLITNHADHVRFSCDPHEAIP